MKAKKWFLYATEFFSGMSVMAVELGASRLLAPYFSSSQIVWTIIIGCIMIAMALGNIWGGRSADKDPNPDKVYGRILIAALWIALIPVLGKYVIAGISLLLALFVKQGFLIWASLISCLVLFIFPLMLLGTVTPSVVKFAMSDPDKSGTTVGELNALNTIGSIIGTFTPTFVTIPLVGTAITFFIFAAILMIIAATYFFAMRKKIVKTVIASVLVAACGVCSLFTGSFAFWENDLVYEGESIYNYLQVYDSYRARYFSTNVLFGVQSMQMLDGSLTGSYYDYDLAAPLMAGVTEKAPEDFDVLILGLATGTFATQCLKYYGDVNVEGVDIDGRIIDIARTYFNLPEEVSAYVSDGRAYLFSGEGKNKKYDVILVDAYQDITIPFQMSSVEFFKLTSEHLKDDGVLVLNMNMYSDENDSINAYIADTVASVYPYVYTARIEDNRELYASFNGEFLNVFETSLKDEPLDSSLKKTLNNALYRLKANGQYQGGDLILTDDKAPVELLGIKLVDSLITEELSYYQNVFKTKGLKGLWEELV